jgi:hypothetical protein
MKTKERELSNVTVTVDDRTLERAKVEAVKKNLSLSRFVGEVLRDYFRRDDAYELAMRESLAEKPLDLKGPWKPYPKREELYDRPVLRRR